MTEHDLQTGRLDPVAEHLADPGQRLDIARLGVWLFLSTEVLFFGVLFLGFTLYRRSYPAEFVAASSHLNLWLGGFNTLVLLTSSLFVALAVLGADRGNRRSSTRYLMATLTLGLVFLAIKAFEWHQEYAEHLVPGLNFNLPDTDAGWAAHEQLFFCLYFIMTGVHAFHMVAGSGVLAWLILRGWRGRGALSQTESIRIESTALYWHFVDIVWVFLLPLLYLTGFD